MIGKNQNYEDKEEKMTIDKWFEEVIAQFREASTQGSFSQSTYFGGKKTEWHFLLIFETLRKWNLFNQVEIERRVVAVNVWTSEIQEENICQGNSDRLVTPLKYCFCRKGRFIRNAYV